MNTRRHRQRWVIPEVVQTSMMDCGPASLKCLLEGFGIPVSYGRLREACQTDVDGTSIDTLEEVAVQLGLDAEQIMVPLDYLLMPEASVLPGLVVALLPNRVTHFVVAWRRHANFLQVMDPATGRRWPTCDQFLSNVYTHTMPVPASTWRDWAGSSSFLTPLMHKIKGLGLAEKDVVQLLERGCSERGWRPLAALEASTRALESLVRFGGMKRGPDAARLLEHLFAKASVENATGKGLLPTEYWSARVAPRSSTGEEQVLFRGAVLIRARGILAACPELAREPGERSFGSSLSPELAAALEEPPSRPSRDLFKLLRMDGAFSPIALTCALFLSAVGVILEALLFRGLLDSARQFGLSGQRLGVMGAVLLFVTGLLLLEIPITLGLMRLGRRLESRLRIAFLEKIPRLGDRYFHSRLNSDMAERGHSIHRIRVLPDLGGQLVRAAFELLLTAAAISWLAPHLAPLALLAAGLAVGLPLAAQPLLAERDLRLRNHVGALSRFYLDALLGLVPVYTHRAERPLRREHESLLTEWMTASFSMQRLVVWLEGIQFITGFGLGAALLLTQLQRVQDSGAVLLLIYWALNLPVLGQDLAVLAWQYPAHRNATLRLLEPIGAREEAEAGTPSSPEEAKRAEIAKRATSGAHLALEKVNVRVAGHLVLQDIDLRVEPGTHVAVVGASGAGKSTLMGILLGWHRPASGKVMVDGETLDKSHCERLRRDTAWVEPSVHLWNRSLFENIRYGAPDGTMLNANLLEQAGLHELLQKLPEGMQSELGEGGALVSGGEGQRVRLARGLLRQGVRLALLDEPFRGLDRRLRHDLMNRARNHWRNTTLLCVTHDVTETVAFPRVLVMEGGRIVEDGAPQDLITTPQSRYRRMLEAENALREGLWSSSSWRHLRLENGQLRESAVGANA